MGSVRHRVGSAGIDGRTTPEERELVQALMLQGWYRDGREPPSSPHGGLWRFRACHCLEMPRRPTILARAPDQQNAMRAVLAWLRQDDGHRVVPALPEYQIVGTEAPDTPPQG
jgi:hypothetical protein